ncbi:ATP-binding cassette domain-containing protein, partial [Thiohalospira sp.]|uniref:ATP-binding cassette domain-containing protein n=1 Tax=Thiohalospira sp. TaxID=3080549 RepID=UPI0039802669
FNVKGGRCEACQGDGVIKVEMHFLPDIHVPCDVCGGKRYNRETLEVRYKGKNIHEVLEMTVEEAREFFDPVPAVARKLQTLMDVGLTYVKLGQSATTLSGGEAQRVKLARELSKRDTGRTLYILDEPTTGLHFHDIEQLLGVLVRLRERGNTILVIEHNLDVIKTADWVLDMGPEGGEGGGQLIAQGTPEEVAANPLSHTGQYLAPMLERAREAAK